MVRLSSGHVSASCSWWAYNPEKYKIYASAINQNVGPLSSINYGFWLSAYATPFVFLDIVDTIYIVDTFLPLTLVAVLSSSSLGIAKYSLSFDA